jgi:hypothetical protein
MHRKALMGQRDSNAVELDLAQGGLGKVGFYTVIE